MGYASLTDLTTYGAPPATFAGISDPEKQAALDEASDFIDDRLRARYALPLLAFPTSFARYAVSIAVYNLMSRRGYGPAAGADELFKVRYDAALRELELIQKQQLHPNVTPQPSQTPTYVQPTVLSSSVIDLSSGSSAPNRGW